MGERLKQVRYDENVAVEKVDNRRTIYNPKKILEGLDGNWPSSNIIVTTQDGAELGKHYHDYEEVFFVPIGEFNFKLVDTKDFETRRYTVKTGGRILIPEGIGHIITGKRGSVLMGYISIHFDPKRLIPLSERALEALASMK